MLKTSLVIWCKDPNAKVLGALKEVLKTDPTIVPIVVNDVDHFPNCAGLQAKIILALGKGPQEFLTSIGALRKKATITSLRGQVYAVGSHIERVMVSYSPLISDVDYGMYIDLLCDTKMAMRYAKTGTLTPSVGSYRYVENFDETLAEVEQKWEATGKPVEVAFDTETLGLDPYHPNAYFVSLQLSHAPGQADVRYFTSKEEMQEAFRSFSFMDSFATLLSSKKVSLRAANGKYDFGWLWAMAGLRPTNFKFDTTLVGSLLDENRSNALDIHAKIYTDTLGGYSDSFDKSVDKSRMDLVPKEALLPYAGGDTDATLQVSTVQKALLREDDDLTNFYINLLHPAARAFEKVEQCGVIVDREAYRELESDLNKAIESCVQKAKKIVGGIMVARHLVDNQNIVRPKFLIDFMFGPDGLNLKPKMWTDGGKDGLGEKKPSTAMEHLFMFGSDPKAKEFVDILKEYSSASKTLATYVIGFQSHIRADGKMHPNYMLHRGNRDEGEGGTVCLTANELVLTARGYIAASKVREGDRVLSHTGVPRGVIEVIDNGVRPVVRVSTDNGLSLSTTENHPYLLVSGCWVEAKNLVVGDKVMAHSDAEMWRGIPGWPDWRVSSWGRVLNDKTKRYATLCSKGKWGHLKVTLRRNGSQTRGVDLVDFPVHRLVALAFLPAVVGKTEIRHLNGISWDNTVRNLAWGTPQENRDDAVKHWTMSKREHAQTKLTEEGVVFIREQPKATRVGGWTNEKLASRFGVCERLVRAVRNGERWGGRRKEGHRATFYPVTVTGVEQEVDQSTFGMTVEMDHSHVTGGLVTHNTGRLSARDPAFQVLPKHTFWAKAIRRCFTAPDGQVIVAFDYSQGELRVIACLADDPTMIEAYRNGMDLHALTAGRFKGYNYQQMMALKVGTPEEQEMFEEIRQLGKAGNFGLIYGMGVDGFLVYADSNFGVKLPRAEGAAFRDGFFDTYSQLPVYHQNYINFARQNGFVPSPLGRKRHLPLIRSIRREVASKAERQAINAPVQSCLSDMGLLCSAELDRMGYFDWAPQFGAVHDQNLFYCPEDKAEEFGRTLKQVAENLPLSKFGWNPQLTFVADVTYGKNLADQKKLKI